MENPVVKRTQRRHQLLKKKLALKNLKKYTACFIEALNSNPAFRKELLDLFIRLGFKHRGPDKVVDMPAFLRDWQVETALLCGKWGAGAILHKGNLHLLPPDQPVRLGRGGPPPARWEDLLEDGHTLVLRLDLRHPVEVLDSLTGYWTRFFKKLVKDQVFYPDPKRARRCFEILRLKQKGFNIRQITKLLYGLRPDFEEREDSLQRQVKRDLQLAREFLARLNIPS